MTIQPRVRFAPSPTGQVHIGNIRTAIFNWLYARHCGGSFLVRVEDTDRERSTPEAIATLFDVMTWLGLDYDEEPLYQSSRADAHLAAAEMLKADGNAYMFAKDDGGEATLFRIPLNAAELPFVREVGPQEIKLHPDAELTADFSGITFSGVSKKGKPVEQGSCLAGMADMKAYGADGTCLLDLAAELEAVVDGAPRTVNGAVRMTFTRHEVVFNDCVKGELAKPIDTMKDQVIVRSNGAPVFHLANVCDDIHQGITHIIRGDDHVENSYRHIFLFHALGAQAPSYAHLPMITNAQGKPYSKRDGDAFVGDFQTKGFLAEALVNYLSLLGWSPGDDREKMTLAEMVDAFTLDRVRSAPSQMDFRKLENLNGQYLADMPFDEFCAQVKPVLAQHPWYRDDDGYFKQVAALMQTRTKLFADAASWIYFYTAALDMDPKLVRKKAAKEGVKAAYLRLAEKLEAIDMSVEAIEAAIDETHDECGFPQGKLNLPLRIAVTGTNAGADLLTTMSILGRDQVVERLQSAAETFFN